MRYEQYGYKDEYDGIPRTYGGFAIVPQRFGLGIGVIIKQRNGLGSSPYLFDLPGGGKSEEDESLAVTAAREAFEEIGVRAFPDTAIAIGSPLWLPVKRDGVIVRVDCAQAFIMETGSEIPTPTEEALTIAVVNERSALGFAIVGLKSDPDATKRVFGRTPIMLWDGLSILNGPFYDQPESAVVSQRLGVHLSEDVYMPVDSGNYFARKRSGNIQMFFRLNPFEESGRFTGNLEDLVKV
ncbi:MAG: hypothetical protein RL518_2105 [Pseudomonadota bacterium]|jgi:8-oxo-dGTP pyrophosphatase MutT (NUDIX family)